MSETYEVKQIIDMRQSKNKTEYLVVWANTWEKASNLTGAQSLIQDFNQQNQNKSNSETQNEDKAVEDNRKDKHNENHKPFDESDDQIKKNRSNKRTKRIVKEDDESDRQTRQTPQNKNKSNKVPKRDVNPKSVGSKFKPPLKSDEKRPKVERSLDLIETNVETNKEEEIPPKNSNVTQESEALSIKILAALKASAAKGSQSQEEESPK